MNFQLFFKKPPQKKPAQPQSCESQAMQPQCCSQTKHEIQTQNIRGSVARLIVQVNPAPQNDQKLRSRSLSEKQRISCGKRGAY